MGLTVAVGEGLGFNAIYIRGRTARINNNDEKP